MRLLCMAEACDSAATALLAHLVETHQCYYLHQVHLKVLIAYARYEEPNMTAGFARRNSLEDDTEICALHLYTLSDDVRTYAGLH